MGWLEEHRQPAAYDKRSARFEFTNLGLNSMFTSDTNNAEETDPKAKASMSNSKKSGLYSAVHRIRDAGRVLRGKKIAADPESFAPPPKVQKPDIKSL